MIRRQTLSALRLSMSHGIYPICPLLKKNVCVGDKDDLKERRRVVELSVLADGLAGCNMCNNPLSLSHTTRVLNYGLGALLKIPCKNTGCQYTNTVPTGKRHQKVFDMNTKLATGMLHAGIVTTHINSLLTALNIPTVSHAMMDRRQRETCDALETLTNKSTEEWTIEELRLTSEQTGDEQLAVSVDAGWQKRGSGKAYDSLSAKAMEQDMIVEMVSECNEKGLKTGTVIGDDDSTTIGRLRRHVDANIKKYLTRIM
ncbi:unnamed protein product [Mytilus coruscus]|uniref:Mutator-like transposase domain-containing protein n=1 Tax=Mytilus coruscus TaxID=42192 RepID=A0A6J8AK29_MYTCO|nr:unnamed protein product [Mytilus coruscus]